MISGTMELAGFRELTREEQVEVNGGKWSIWKVIGMAAAGWCKLFALEAVNIEMSMGDYYDAENDIYYWWGDGAEE